MRGVLVHCSEFDGASPNSEFGEALKSMPKPFKSTVVPHTAPDTEGTCACLCRATCGGTERGRRGRRVSAPRTLVLRYSPSRPSTPQRQVVVDAAATTWRCELVCCSARDRRDTKRRLRGRRASALRCRHKQHQSMPRNIDQTPRTTARFARLPH